MSVDRNRISQVFLVRHGRTVLNAEGRLRGLADPELDETGVAQVRATAAVLQPLGLLRVVCSPLRRAVHTASVIAQPLGLTPEVDPAFTDRDYGPWTGRVKADVIHQWGSVDAAPGVEEASTVLSRALQGLNNLSRSTRGPAAVVTHDAVIRLVLASIRPGLSPQVETGSWAELAGTADGWAIVSVDNTAPLGDDRAARAVTPLS